MWGDKKYIYKLEDYMIKYLMFHKEKHTLWWSAMQTNVGIIVDSFVLQTKYLLIFAFKKRREQ